MTMEPNSIVVDFPLRLMVHHAGGSYDLTFFLNLPAHKAARIISFARHVSGGYSNAQTLPARLLAHVDDMPLCTDKFKLWHEGLGGNHLQFETLHNNGPRALEYVHEKLAELLASGKGTVDLSDHTNSEMPCAFVKKHVLPSGGLLPGLGAPLHPTPPARLKQHAATPLSFFLGSLIQAERNGGIERLG